MDYAEQTQTCYDYYFDQFSEKFKRSFESVQQKIADEFFTLLPPKSSLLDVGAGTGLFALYAQKKGHQVLCIDSSSAMSLHCLSVGLDSRQMSMETLELFRKFNGIWCFTSVCHIPKEMLSQTLEKFHGVLQDEGVAMLAFRQGNENGLRTDERYPKAQRWFSAYSHEELLQYLGTFFSIISHKVVTSDSRTWLVYFLRRV